MQVILMEKVVNLGALGDVVKVKDGFARNYLIPQGMAKRATAANLKEFEGRWDEMGTLVSDDILSAFAVVGEPQTIARQIRERYGDIIDRTSAAYANIAKEDRKKIIAELTAA